MECREYKINEIHKLFNYGIKVNKICQTCPGCNMIFYSKVPHDVCENCYDLNAAATICPLKALGHVTIACSKYRKLLRFNYYIAKKCLALSKKYDLHIFCIQDTDQLHIFETHWIIPENNCIFLVYPNIIYKIRLS